MMHPSQRSGKSSRVHSKQNSSATAAEISQHAIQPPNVSHQEKFQNEKSTQTRPAMSSGPVRARRLVSWSVSDDEKLATPTENKTF